MADRQGDLFREVLEQGGHLLPQVVPHVHRVQPRLDEVARVEDVADPAENGQGGLPGRDRFGADVIEALLVVAGRGETIDDGRDLLAETLGRGEVDPALFQHVVHDGFDSP